MSAYVVGDRMVVRAEHAATVLIHWAAPMTTGVFAALPVGTKLVVRHSGPSGFDAVPEDYERMERLLVPADDLASEKYDGYSVAVSDDEVGTWLTTDR
jgi:hypothetical protein